LTEYFAVKNWDKLQHYSKRNPPWIRLYKNFMADAEIASLPDSAKFHLVSLWCLAAEYDNRIPCDSVLLKRRMIATCNVKLSKLFELGLIIPIVSNKNASTGDPDCYTRAVQSSTEQSIYKEHFEEVWNEYPEKKGKEKAWAKFQKQVQTWKALENIKYALEHYKTEVERCRANSQPDLSWQHGSTWFNDNWKDYIDYKPPEDDDWRKLAKEGKDD